MFNKLSLRSKLTGIIVLLVIITVFVSGYLSYDLRKKNLEANYMDNLNALADLKIENINEFVEEAEADIQYIRSLPVFEEQEEVVFDEGDQEEESGDMDMFGAMDMDMGGDEDDGGMGMMMGMEEETDDTDYASTLNPITEVLGVKSIIVTSFEGDLLFSSNPDIFEENIRKFVDGYNSEVLEKTQQGMYFSRVFKNNGDFSILVGSPVDASKDESKLVYILINLSDLYQLIENDLQLGETVETILVQKRENNAFYLNPIKSDSSVALSRNVDLDTLSNDGEEEADVTGGNKDTAVKEAALGREGFGTAVDYHGNDILASWRYVPKIDWGLVVKIDRSELSTQANNAVLRFGLFGLGIIIIAVFLSILLSRYFVNPLLSLRDNLNALSRGVLPNRIDKEYDDEIGQMAETTNELTQGLKRTATFAEQIGQGELNAEFTPLSDEDILGTALLNMRQNLLENEKRDKERNWIVTGVAEISEILRSHNTINELGDAVVAYITDKVEAIQGAFYIVNDDDEDDVFIEMKAAYAYNKKKYVDAKFKFAQGLVGQSAAEQASIVRTEIPEDYVSITSGLLGEKRPGCILITPMITEEKVFGVLEFASINKLAPMQIRFVEEISVIIARTIFNIKVNERTRKLLEESQKMSNELQEQQEVLRQNAEEMAATQEELKRTNQRLEDQIEEVNRTQNRMQLLLENASEVIAIYEEDGTIRYISPSVNRILGYDQNDLIGTNDIEHVHSEYVDQYEKMFKEVKENAYESKTVQYEYIKKDGAAIWLEATATNLLSDKSITGIIVNSRDITERRRAEQEERMRSKMQALSENSPDLITRLDGEGNVFYINPIIENYTGYKPSDLLNQNLQQVDIPDELKGSWMDLLKKVESENDKVATEMDFPSKMGDRVMQVNAIPEYDESEKMESVLMVSHDITDRKLIELEIQSKNKKITESINYAKRIQGAILPNNAVIRKFLPDSFILYKAKDVVSGDFPWFVRVDNIIYFAAVDCTGHGVPGALISLIGYFLLNEIVKGRKITDPGEILDKLDHSVTQTLRQDQDDSKTKDGMDIALCKIDIDNNELTYAGAHRPLYYHNGKELEEIKGDRFPIGGGIFKNQTNFTSSPIKLKKGDSVFFCSDGYPDQFGGPKNRKFGPKRLRALISDNADKDMEELYQVFDNAWEDWKGEYKQTDDVLLMGIRF